MIKFNFKSLLFIFTLFALANKGLLAQEKNETFTRWSAGLGLGVPVTLFGVNSKPVGIYMGNARYSFTKNFSLEARLTANVFYNNNTGNAFNAGATLTPGVAANEVMNYRSAMNGLHGIMYYNLTDVFGLSKDGSNNWAPYVSFGGGLHLYKFQYNAIDGSSGRMDNFGPKPARDYQLGIGSRYYLNENIDLNFGAEYHYVESYYLDAAAADRKLDNYLNFYLGAQYKIGAKKWKNGADWAFKNGEKEDEHKSDYTKWSIDANVGLPYMVSPVGYSFTGMGGLGVRRSFSRLFSLGLNYHVGNLSASQSVTAIAPGTALTQKPEEVKEVSNTVQQFTLRGFINLKNFRSEPETRQTWNHYLVLGYGFLISNQSVEFADGSSRSGYLGSTGAGAIANNRYIRNPVLGYQARKYINQTIDWSMGIDYSRNETRWLDAAPNKTGTNPHFYLYTGVAVKLGNKKAKKENIDWAYRGYSSYREKQVALDKVPVIAKKDPEPVKPVEPAKEVDSRVVEIPDVKQPVKEAPVEEKPAVAEPVVPKQPEVQVQPVTPPVTPPAKPATPPTQPVVPAEPAKPATAVTTPTTPVKPAQPPVKPQEPVSKPKPIVVDQPKAEPNTGNEVTAPPMKYNVIVACYTAGNERIAINYKKSLERKGYSPSLYRDSDNSRIIRLSILSTDNRDEAIAEWRKARRSIEPASWIHLYNKQ